MTKRALKEPALTKYGSVPMMRRPSAEVAAGEDPAIREARLKHQREAWKARRAGKRRLCIDVTEELLAQIKTASELHEMSQQFLVNFILERELPKWGKR
jgi:lipase chaperone LimK